jgi:aminoglycoside phosphotransferase family enzyme
MGRTAEYCGQLAEALARPGALPEDERLVRDDELPSSVVFVTDRRRLKLVKEGLERGDDQAARRLACERAFRRNRQLSGRLYLGIAPLVRAAGLPVQLGDAAQVRGGARTLDWVIECRLSNREHALACWVQRGVAPNGFESTLANELAAFHTRARTGPRINHPTATRWSCSRSASGSSAIRCSASWSGCSTSATTRR